MTENEMIGIILAASDALLASCVPVDCSTKRREIRRDGTGQYVASVVQITSTAAGLQEDLLDSRRFGTERNARRWLNRQI